MEFIFPVNFIIRIASSQDLVQKTPGWLYGSRSQGDGHCTSESKKFKVKE